MAQRPATMAQPPLRARQAVEGIAAALRLPFAAAAAMVVREAELLGIEPHALVPRWVPRGQLPGSCRLEAAGPVDSRLAAAHGLAMCDSAWMRGRTAA
jgi:hypothetical protein